MGFVGNGPISFQWGHFSPIMHDLSDTKDFLNWYFTEIADGFWNPWSILFVIEIQARDVPKCLDLWQMFMMVKIQPNQTFLD
jgi:hypothetical protein